MVWLWSSSTAKPDDELASQSSSTTKQLTPDSTSPAIALSAPESTPETSRQAEDLNAAYPHLTSSQPETASELKIDPAYPTTMSCRAAFDQAFYCSSFGGHFNDVYRYGELRSCSEHWGDWRFCMGLKTRSKNDKVELIQERYRQKEERIKEKANSEDVWKRRKEGDRHLGAFNPDWEGETQ